MTASDAPARKTTVFCVLDGWGYREDPSDNAVAQAHTPVFDRLWASQPRGFMRASEEAVGLPRGQIGNSEVGHMNLGAGRVVLQDLLKITKAIAEGELNTSNALQAHVAALKASGGTCHLMGLLSGGGVHAHQDHMVGLAKAVAKQGVPVVVHAFTDGRDTPPRDAQAALTRFLNDLDTADGITVGTVDGRYYAMDRDQRWERVEKAYRAIVLGEGLTAATALEAVAASYAADTGDEFILPTVIDGYDGMVDGDGVLFANFRADRARQLLMAILDPGFDGFARDPVQVADACGMVQYSDVLNRFMSAIFPPKSLSQVLGELVSAAGKTQLRLAETEKYPHVTFFFNGGEETQFNGEERIMVPSPKVATYDLQPEMSAPEVANHLVSAIDSGRFDLIIINFANPDMVGHTGILSAAVKAVETVDVCLGQAVEAIKRNAGTLLFTADHGNCEIMRDAATGEPHTAHTLSLVPVVLVNGPADVHSLHDGRLADVAPTLLELMGLAQPAEMTGRSLLNRVQSPQASE